MPEPISDRAEQEKVRTRRMLNGIFANSTSMTEPDRAKKTDVRISEVIFEMIIANEGVCESGNGSSDSLMFIDPVIELLSAMMVNTPITSDSGDALPRITIIRKVNTMALNNGSRTTHKSPSL